MHCEKRTAPAGEDAGDGESSQPSLRCIPDDGEDDSDHDANVRADHAEGDSVAVRFIPFFFFFDNIPLRNGVPDMPPATNPAVGQHQTGDGSIGYDDDSQCLSDGEA